MISLTFGEQVKIVLSRKGMTIKELAERIEERTGKKMSRQNLTQRLGRDNFQEQDMRMIADILGCSFQLSILASVEAAEKASVIEEVPPTSKELDKLAAKKERKAARAEAKELEEAERDITVGEIVDLLDTDEESKETSEVLPEVVSVQEEVQSEQQEEAALPADTEEQEIQQEEQVESVTIDVSEMEPPVAEEENVALEVQVEEEKDPEEVFQIDVEEVQEEQPAADTEESVAEELPKNEHKGSPFSKITKIISSPRREEKRHEKAKDFQPIKKRSDEDEDLVNGDVNPYTGHEYQTNSVRMHPKRIGYVQVYDRKEHKWTDMTEWAFLGFEERKKATLGKDYEPPIYLD